MYTKTIMNTKISLLLPFLVLSLSGCSFSFDGKHRCNFNQEIASDSYLVHEANCEEGAEYYKSCTCGNHGEETFTVGEGLGHYYDGGEFYTSDEVIFPVTVRDDEVAVIYTCGACGKSGIREDVKKENVAGHQHFSHAYTHVEDANHTGECAICSESFVECCQYREGSCHKCGSNE